MPVPKLASVLAVIPAGVIYRGDLVQLVTTLTSFFPDPDHWIAILQTVCGGVGGWVGDTSDLGLRRPVIYR